MALAHTGRFVDTSRIGAPLAGGIGSAFFRGISPLIHYAPPGFCALHRRRRRPRVAVAVRLRHCGRNMGLWRVLGEDARNGCASKKAGRVSFNLLPAVTRRQLCRRAYPPPHFSMSSFQPFDVIQMSLERRQRVGGGGDCNEVYLAKRRAPLGQFGCS